MQFYGGPLDGLTTDRQSPDGAFTIFPSDKDNRRWSCYQCVGKYYRFVEERTTEQLIMMGELGGYREIR